MLLFVKKYIVLHSLINLQSTSVEIICTFLEEELENYVKLEINEYVIFRSISSRELPVFILSLNSKLNYLYSYNDYIEFCKSNILFKIGNKKEKNNQNLLIE